MTLYRSLSGKIKFVQSISGKFKSPVIRYGEFTGSKLEILEKHDFTSSIDTRGAKYTQKIRIFLLLHSDTSTHNISEFRFAQVIV